MQLWRQSWSLEAVCRVHGTNQANQIVEAEPASSSVDAIWAMTISKADVNKKEPEHKKESEHENSEYEDKKKSEYKSGS